MKLHRFIGDFDLTKPLLVSGDKELLNQIKNVLRLASGDRVVLVAGQGSEAIAEIDDLNKEELSFRVLESRASLSESDNFVTLYCSILKRENFELVAQKATECGVKRIVPVISGRTIKTGLKTDRLKKIIKEASEQSGRAVVPELGPISSLVEALREASTHGAILFFDPTGERSFGKNSGSIGIFIGPEGGWEESEIQLAKENRGQIVSLGSLTLRGETAAIVASYLAVNPIE